MKASKQPLAGQKEIEKIKKCKLLGSSTTYLEVRKFCSQAYLSRDTVRIE